MRYEGRILKAVAKVALDNRKLIRVVLTEFLRDGVVTEQEQQIFKEIQMVFKMDRHEFQKMYKEIHPNPVTINKGIPKKGLKKDVFKKCYLTALVDGKLDEREAKILERLAKAMKLQPEEYSGLLDTVGEAKKADTSPTDLNESQQSAGNPGKSNEVTGPELSKPQLDNPAVMEPWRQAKKYLPIAKKVYPILFIIFCLFFWTKVLLHELLELNGKQTTGMVTGKSTKTQTSSSSPAGITHFIHFSYSVNGKKYDGRQAMGKEVFSNYRAWEKIEVYYLPLIPSICKTDFTIPLIFPVLVGVLLTSIFRFIGRKLHEAKYSVGKVPIPRAQNPLSRPIRPCAGPLIP